jgi:hypothetical protein
MDKINQKAEAAVYEPILSNWYSSSSQREKEYSEIVKECRFFYRNDPIASTVINKLVEIGITELTIDISSLTANEEKIYSFVLAKLQKFLRQCALEYLISGMVVPEITFEPVDRETLREIGVKKYAQLYLPTSLWVRNSEHIKINTSFFGADTPSYFIKIPDELIYFIKSGGIYSDGREDKQHYKWLEKNYQAFVREVKNGKTEILLDNPLIIRRTYLPDSPYPIPYLYPALESLKHKRNLRLMDYALAGRVIQAIQHVRVGSDKYPLLEGEEGVFDDIRNQLRQVSYSKEVNKIIQLFTNHTVEISWILPDVNPILNPNKYEEINNDIFFALGFPRILTTGETQRTQTSNHELATKSPIKTMEKMQQDLLPIAQFIVSKIREKNDFPSRPEIRFKHLDFYQFADFMQGLFKLREERAISLETLSRYFGLDYSDEQEKISNELQNQP